jgi:hypothetical protein
MGVEGVVVIEVEVEVEGVIVVIAVVAVVAVVGVVEGAFRERIYATPTSLYGR